MIKIVLLCLLSVAVYAKPAVNEQEVSEPVTFLKLIKSQKVPEIGKRFDISGSLSLFEAHLCGGAKSVYVCDGRCFNAGSKPFSLEINNLPSGYKAEVSFFDGHSCNDRYIGTTELYMNTCYDDNNGEISNTGSFSCVPSSNVNHITIHPPSP